MPWDLLIKLIPILPLAGFAFTALFGRRLQARYGIRAASLVPVAAVVLVWIIAMLVVFATVTHTGPWALTGTGDGGEEAAAGATGYFIEFWKWIPAGGFSGAADREVIANVGFYVDGLTAALLIVVTTVGMLVHLYSLGYMSHDEGYWRFFAYLNLFMFSMLILVLASNWLVVFVAWELVGLSSYLLIGFWYRKRSAALAAKKAFIVNRVGDVGFALGIMAIWVNTGTLDIRESLEVLTSQPLIPFPVPVWIVALLVFAGAVGKSAQFPLHVWLPDAMEGPTPVSALIHAATMVNAGVYLVARANPLFASAPQVMAFIALIGIFTAILAASIAFTQTDIKRVLAYSTLSQLGYMFAALGVGAWTAAIFHLMTHGFFKGLLFLGSGSVIHAVHEEQDMRRMGGLRKKIPITYATMLIGSIAIAGIPPLAGFFSKDEILGEAWKLHFQWVWAIGIVVAMMTAFYMFRLIGLTFWGESRVDPHVEPRIHESPRSMTWPLIALAVPSVLAGLVLSWPGVPLGPLLGQVDPEGHPLPGLLASWLAPVFHEGLDILGHEEASFQFLGIDGLLIGASIAVAVAGIVLASRFFGWEVGVKAEGDRDAAHRIAQRIPFLYRASLNKWWFDELNHLLFIVIGGRIAMALWWFDRNVVDGAVNGIGTLVRGSGGGLRRVQTGHVQNYALGIAIGLLVMAGSFIVIASR